MLGLAKSGHVGPWFGPGLPDLPVKGDSAMTIRIVDDTMTLEVDNRVVATARFSEHVAADRNGAWIVSTCPARLFDRAQAITAVTVAKLLAVGYAATIRLVVALRACLR